MSWLDKYFDGVDVKAFYGDTFGGLMLGLGLGSAPAPTTTVTSVDKSEVSVAGGDYVVLTGTGFVAGGGASYVRFGGTNAASYTVDSPMQVTAVTPAKPYTGSPVDVSVGFAMLPNAMEFIMRVSDAYPDVVSHSLATHITILGEGFTGATDVSLVDGANHATSCDSLSALKDDLISCRTPTGLAAGLYTVKVTTPSGTVSGGSIRLWDPVDIAVGCAGHWDTNAFALVGGVIQYTDLTGQAHHLAPPASGNAPTYADGDPTATGFDTNPTANWPNTPSNSIFLDAAGATTPNPYTVVMFCYPGDGVSNGIVWCGIADPKPYLQRLNTNDNAGSSFSVVDPITSTMGRLLVDERLAGVTNIYEQQFTTPIATGTTGTSALGGFTVGNVHGGGLGAQAMKWAWAFVAKGQLTSTEKTYLLTWAQARMQVDQPAPRWAFYATGNSITASEFASAQNTTGYADLVIKGLPNLWKGVKDGNPGIRTDQLKDGHTLWPLLLFAPNQMAFFDELVNAINTGITSSTAFSDWQAWAAKLSSMGIGKLIGATCMKTTIYDSGKETVRQATNALILSGATKVPSTDPWLQYSWIRSDGIYIVDKASLPKASDPTDVRYFYDGLHPRDPLHADIGNCVLATALYAAAHP